MFWRIFVENRIIWKTVPLLSKSHESELRALGYSVLIFKYSESDPCKNTRVIVFIHIETSQLIEPYIT